MRDIRWNAHHSSRGKGAPENSQSAIRYDAWKADAEGGEEAETFVDDVLEVWKVLDPFVF